MANTAKGKLDELNTKVTNLVNTTFPITGDAVVANVLTGKKFYKDDVNTQLTGTMPNSTADITPTGAAITIPAGYHDGSKHVLASATLLPENIKAGVTIYGVLGTYAP